MEKEIKEVFGPLTLETGASLFGVPVSKLTFLGAWQNFIYEYQSGNQSFILRFTPSSHRSADAVRGELDWILYLAENVMSVSKPIRSREGNWTETVHAGECSFTVASFEKAEGRKIGYPDCLHDHSLYEQMGRTMGRMHALSMDYVPNEEAFRRHDWEQNYYLRTMENFVPADQPKVHEARKRLIQTVKETLGRKDTGKENFGLIHGDLTMGNFTVHDQGLTLFDFDEAQYSWFAEDIAIPLYYLVYVYGGEDGRVNRESQVERFLEHFLKGYTEEFTFREEWLQSLPLFLMMREMIVYTGMYRSSDLTKPNEWRRDFLAESRVRIENGVPIVNVWGW